MRRRIRPVWVAALVLALAPAALPDDPTLAETFDRTAGSRGQEYVIGRDLLLDQGERLRSFLADRPADTVWGARQLAAVLALRLNAPDRVAEIRSALKTHRVEVGELEDGRIRITSWRWQARGNPLKRTLAVAGDDVPVLVEILRESGLGGQKGSHDQVAAQAAIESLGRLRSADAVPVLIELLDGFSFGDYEPVYGAFVRIGDPARAPLLARFLGASVGEPTTAEEHRALYGTARAVRALGRLGGEGVEDALVGRLPEAEPGDLTVAIARALLDLGSAAGLAAVFDRQIAILDRRRLRLRDGSSDRLAKYGDLRAVLRAAGEILAPLLRERSAPERSLAERVLARGLLFEIEEPKAATAFYRALGRNAMGLRGGMPGMDERTPKEEAETGHDSFWSEGSRWSDVSWPAPVPRPLLHEAAYVYAGTSDLERIARHRDDALGDEIVVDALRGPLRNGPAGELPLLLADRGDPAVLDLFAELIEKAKPPRPPKPVPFVRQLVEAMLRLGDPGAIPLLERIVARQESDPRWGDTRYRAAYPLAKAALAFFRAGADDYAGLLGSEIPEVRVATARALARAGDVRGLGVLLDAVLADPDGEYLRLRPSLTRLGAPALPGLATRRESTDDLRARVVLDALRVRLEDPDRARRVAGVVERNVPHTGRQRGPGLDAYVAGGREAAKAFGAGDRPILEEIALFPDEYGLSRVALFALAALGDERSIPVVTWVARTDRAAAVAAFPMFGDAGLAAAKKIPPPNPARPAFPGRASRHTAAAETLAKAKDPLAVEKILETLTAPEPEDYGAMQAARRETVEQLKIAAGLHDERLVEPVIHLIETTRWNNVRRAAFVVIGFYEDERIVPLILPRIPASQDQYDTALRALVRQLGPEVGPFLLARFREAPDEATKLRYAQALSRLRRHGSYRTYRDPAPDDSAERREAVAGTEALALEALGDLLVSASAPRRREAADELARLYLFEETTAALELLLPWVPGEAEPPRSVVYRLSESKIPGAGEALLASYVKGDRRVGYVAEVLGRLAYAPALADLVLGMEERLRDGADHRHSVPEIAALAKLGEEGEERVLEVLESDAPEGVRVGAAHSLGEAGYEPAFDAAEALFGPMLRRGFSPDDGTPGRRHTREQEGIALLTVSFAMARMAPAKAYRSLSLLLMTEERDRPRRILLDTLADIAMRHPDLKRAPAELK